jgi:hypothetical protein
MESWDRLKSEYSYEYIKTDDKLKHTSKLPVIYTKSQLVPFRSKLKASSPPTVPGWFGEKNSEEQHNGLALSGDKPITVSSRTEIYKSPRYPHAKLPKVASVPKTTKYIKKKFEYKPIQGVLHQFEKDERETVQTPISQMLSRFSVPSSASTMKYDIKVQTDDFYEPMNIIKVRVDLRSASKGVVQASRANEKKKLTETQSRSSKIIKCSKSEPNIIPKNEGVTKVGIVPSAEISPYLIELYNKYPLLKLDELYFKSRGNLTKTAILDEIPEETREAMIRDLVSDADPSSIESVKKIGTEKRKRLFDGYMKGLMTGKLKTKEDAVSYVENNLRNDGLYTVRSISRESQESEEYETLESYMRRKQFEDNTARSTGRPGKSASMEIDVKSVKNPEDMNTFKDYSQQLTSEQGVNTDLSPINSDRFVSDEKILYSDDSRSPHIVSDSEMHEQEVNEIVETQEVKEKESYREVEDNLTEEALAYRLEKSQDLVKSQESCNIELSYSKSEKLESCEETLMQLSSSHISLSASSVENKSQNIIQASSIQEPLEFILESKYDIQEITQPVQNPSLNSLNSVTRPQRPSILIKPSSQSKPLQPQRSNSKPNLHTKPKRPQSKKLANPKKDPKPAKRSKATKSSNDINSSQHKIARRGGGISIVLNIDPKLTAEYYNKFVTNLSVFFSTLLTNLPQGKSLASKIRESLGPKLSDFSYNLQTHLNLNLLDVPISLNLRQGSPDFQSQGSSSQSQRSVNGSNLGMLGTVPLASYQHEDAPKSPLLPFTKGISNRDLLQRSFRKSPESKQVRRAASWTESENESQEDSESSFSSDPSIKSDPQATLIQDPYIVSMLKLAKSTSKPKSSPRSQQASEGIPLEGKSVSNISSSRTHNEPEAIQANYILEDVDINTKLNSMFKFKSLHKGFAFTPQVLYDANMYSSSSDVDDLNQIDLHNHDFDQEVLDSISMKKRFYQTSKYLPSCEKLSRKQIKHLHITAPENPLPEQLVQNQIKQIEKKKKREKFVSERMHNPPVYISDKPRKSFTHSRKSDKKLKLSIDPEKGGEYDELILNQWKDSIHTFKNTHGQLFNSKSCRDFIEMKISRVSNFISDNLEVLSNTR